MAGESPDRSKQRESSAEPTSGSAGPVPEARSGSADERRDPRLAMAREAAQPTAAEGAGAGSAESGDADASAVRGGVDTATRVFSVRELTPETATENAEDAGSGAVEAGVRDSAGEGASGAAGASDGRGAAHSGEGAGGASGGKGPAGENSSGSAGDSEAGSAEERSADVTGESEAEEKSAADADDDSGDTDGTEAAEESTAGAAGDSEAEAAEESSAGTTSDSRDTDTTSGPGNTDETGPAEESSSATTDSSGDADGAGSAREDSSATTSDSRDTDETGPAEESSSGAADDSGDTDGNDSADAARDSDGADVNDSSSGVAEGSGGLDADVSGERDAGSSGATDESASGERNQDTSADTDGPGDRAEGAAAGDNRLRAAVAAWVTSGDEDKAAGDDDTERADEADAPAAGTAPGSDAKVAEKAEESARTRTTAAGTSWGSDAKRSADADTPAPYGSEKAPTEPHSPTASDSDGAPEATTEPATDGPAAADGEDTPQGPPADDDESRTGGAGGNKKAAGKAEAAVDQPTTVFKAVRPPKPPQVDQPTTMLKLGGTPKPPAEPDRTSKFVALKPLDEPRPTQPPKPTPPDATAAVPQVGPERTTQQPLPPKPPLDLLAELTNTPPPPDTAVRTAIRRVKIWTPLVLLLAIVFAVVQTLRPLPEPTLDLTAKSEYTFDGSKVDIPWPSAGQAALDVQGIGTFGSSGDQKPVPIASVAKVMTAYVILRDHPLKSGAEGPNIKIDQTAEDQADAGQESTVDVTANDEISQREALESILIASANNVARLLARWDAGSEKAFVEKMNAAAEDLGMTNTTYTDPSGLNNTTVSTAVDQVKLGKAAMEQPAFREVAAMMSYDDYKGVNHSNWNQLVGRNNVVGIKTGTTTSALGNLVFAAKQEVGGETRTIVGAVVRQPAGGVDNTILSAALTAGDQLMRAAQDALESATILKKGDIVGHVDDGLGGRTPVVATEDVTAVGWAGLKVKLTFAADDVPHTAKAGTKVGTLTVGDGTSSSAVKVPVALQTDLTEPGFTDKLTRVS
ncbi:hypothetical protein AQJ91_23005 [Streptomyces dysideae]|uniref:serine-type D-Ala-D-Ala carboxypeptidase n=1 Tax=Streptomyces dysideae TaxID=909626 RepID=A0A101UXM1_9ACTN|nr:hypothetical protein AQJ91_23005 [Streptomyces dysideae]